MPFHMCFQFLRVNWLVTHLYHRNLLLQLLPFIFQCLVQLFLLDNVQWLNLFELLVELVPSLLLLGTFLLILLSLQFAFLQIFHHMQFAFFYASL